MHAALSGLQATQQPFRSQRHASYNMRLAAIHVIKIKNMLRGLASVSRVYLSMTWAREGFHIEAAVGCDLVCRHEYKTQKRCALLATIFQISGTLRAKGGRVGSAERLHQARSACHNAGSAERL